MDIIKDIYTYPRTVFSRDIHNYVQRNCPCIVFYHLRYDPNNDKIYRFVKCASKKYPNVFCYKLGWKSFLLYYPNAKSELLYRITVWKNNKKLMFLDSPTMSQVEKMFFIVYRKILNEDKNEYISILKMQIENSKKFQYRSKKRLNTIQISDLCSHKKSFNKSFKNEAKLGNFNYSSSDFKTYHLEFKKTKKLDLNYDLKSGKINDKTFDDNILIKDNTNIKKQENQFSEDTSIAESLLFLKYGVTETKLPQENNILINTLVQNHLASEKKENTINNKIQSANDVKTRPYVFNNNRFDKGNNIKIYLNKSTQTKINITKQRKKKYASQIQSSLIKNEDNDMAPLEQIVQNNVSKDHSYCLKDY